MLTVETKAGASPSVATCEMFVNKPNCSGSAITGTGGISQARATRSAEKRLPAARVVVDYAQLRLQPSAGEVLIQDGDLGDPG